MKKIFLTLSVCVFNYSAMANATPSQSIDQFCSDRSSESFNKELLQSADNLMAFANRGGIANGGVCWWHSRFQRNATYITVYRPSEKKPNKAQVEKIITKIRLAKEIVVIPGFRNFNEFSWTFSSEIQSELDKWQKIDGVVKFNVVEVSTLKSMMDELYEYVELEGNIAYQKLQIKGITAHAWLVVNMIKVSNGYDLEVLDSNYPDQTQIYRYREGMTSFTHSYYGNFTPYLERKSEMNTIKMTILKQCNPKEYKAIKAKEIEDRRKASENQSA